MKKERSNALWNELTCDQRKALDKWLFEEKLGHEEVWRRAQAQFKYKGSESSVRRYYARRLKERTLTEFKDLRDELAAISDTPVNVESLRVASMKLLGRFLFQQMRQSPEKVKEWGAAAGLMLQNDHNEVLREGQKIKERWLTFAKEKFQFDTMEQAMKALPELYELAEAKKDPHTRRYVENAHWNLVRRNMFGPGIEIAPENAEEEAAMIAAKKEREERRAKEAQREREKVKGAQPPPPGSPYHQDYIEKKAKQESDEWKMAAEYEI